MPAIHAACATLLLLFAAIPAAADGLVLDLRTPGVAGPQVDSVELSPAERRPDVVSGSWESYVVQPGDTLGAISGRLGISPAELAKRNRPADPDRLSVGQTLQVAGDPADPPLFRIHGPLVRLQIWPWPPAQGQTLVLWLTARSPITYSLDFRGTAHAVCVDGLRAWSLIPLASLADPGPAPLEVNAGGWHLRLEVPVEAGAFPTEQIPASASDPLLSQTEKVSAETARMAEIFSADGEEGWGPRSRFVAPLADDFPRTSPFGSRRTYGGSATVTSHTGEDYSAAPGTLVLAPAEGRVVLAEQLFVRGNAVILDHGSGIFTGYWHLSEVAVKVGQRVTPGELLGKVGSTGLSTGAHLHWEMRVAGTAVDPLQWIDPE